MSAPQLESLLVAVMSLLHALYRQDPNAAPVSTSDDAAVAALDNQSLVGMETSDDCILAAKTEVAAKRLQRASNERIEAPV